MYRSTTQNLNPSITVSEAEYETLADIICASERATPGLALLWAELDRAVQVAGRAAPADVVALGSRVTFTDCCEGRPRSVRLTHPDDVDGPDDVGATGELGAALLGLRAGDLFQWSSADGALRRLRIEHVSPPLAAA